MRRVYSRKEERERKGRRARKDIVSYYSEEKVALNVLDRLQKIQEKIKKKKSK